MGSQGDHGVDNMQEPQQRHQHREATDQQTTMLFDIIKNVRLVEDHGGVVAARLGQLAFPRSSSTQKQKQTRIIETPNFISITSRGSVPHMTPDVVTKHTQLGGAYMALEDFVELSQKRKSPALYNVPSSLLSPPPSSEAAATAGGSPGALHFYTATPASQAIVMGARRHPAQTAPMGNGQDYLTLFTSTGWQKLRVEDYCTAVQAVRPDIAIPLADLTYGYADNGGGNKMPNSKRQVRMVDRTEDWIAKFFAWCHDDNDDVNNSSNNKDKKNPEQHQNKDKNSITGNNNLKTLLQNTAVFAPTLPVEYSIQWDYLNRLSQDHRDDISGLAVYDADILAEIGGNYPALEPLPRLSMDYFVTPQQVLRQVQLGMDLFTVPFVNTASDAGIAMTFEFLPPTATQQGGREGNTSSNTRILPLGMDMWSETHRTAVEPLLEGCSCYVCTRHHRAFLQHLLNAKEMLGWTLLQVHNHHIMSKFFADIRKTLADETAEKFYEYCRLFSLRYESELPKGTGERPRARGYHFKGEPAAGGGGSGDGGGRGGVGGAQGKMNKPAWEKYESDNCEQTRNKESNLSSVIGPGRAKDGSGSVTLRDLAGEAAGLAVAGAADGTETPIVPEGDAGDLVEKGFAEMG